MTDALGRRLFFHELKGRYSVAGESSMQNQSADQNCKPDFIWMQLIIKGWECLFPTKPCQYPPTCRQLVDKLLHRKDGTTTFIKTVGRQLSGH
ncbi:hypothetical protein ACIQW9_14590 [Herminiimonas sp. NPDC097707]|uniref:hypothetical protein n=1 Tax=Herminiimonas sp. NPDC097707 TaxID=3364007 RepID=UPI003839FD8D